MPFVQFGVGLDHLRVFQELVAEVVHDGGDGEDATEAFVQGRLRHNVLPSLSRSDSVAMPSRRATRLTIPKGTPVSWIVSSTLLGRCPPRGELEEMAGDSPACWDGLDRVRATPASF